MPLLPLPRCLLLQLWVLRVLQPGLWLSLAGPPAAVAGQQWPSQPCVMWENVCDDDDDDDDDDNDDGDDDECRTIV